MNKLPYARALAVLAGITVSIATQTADAKLTIGDPAPKLQVGKWIQGEPVEHFDASHVYIVEFWATWCGPCVASIPHLNDLAQKFKDKGVIVIGQDVWDQDDAVPAFVKKMGDKMTYRVALDDKRQDTEGFMAAHWWKRKVDQHGIPNAFVINKAGRIAWIGHPNGLNEKLIEDILADKFDLAKFAAEYEKQQQDNQKLGDAENKLFSAVDDKKWNEAASSLDELLRMYPNLEAGFTPTRFKILLGQKKFAEAWSFAESFSNTHPADASRQNALAWEIVAPEMLEQRNLDLAEKLAGRANQAAHGKDANILDTLARAQFMSGKKKEAIETEQKALDAAPDEEKMGYQKFLTSYQQDKLPKVNE
jgi:thiol-disulfide isomerase/thioredoxin